MPDDDYVASLRRTAARMGFLALCVQDFAVQIMRHVIAGGTLDDDALSEIRQTCITNLKNSHSVGASMEEEAEIFGQAVEELNNIIDGAINMAREP